MRWMSLLFLFPALAWAIPGTIHQEGFLTDARGVPREGATQLSFTIYEQVEGGAALWTEAHNLNLVEGYFSLHLGAQNAFGAALDGDSRFLSLSVDGVEMLPRVPLASSPYALTAQNVVGDITPRSISVGGQQVIDEGGNWVGPAVPGADDGVGYNTPAAALAAIKSVDGATTGLDADTLDGIDSAAFLQNGDQVMALLLNADGANSTVDADRLDGHDSSAFVRTAARLLELLLTADGTNSGLDVDTLDGHDSVEFVDVTDPATAVQLFNLLLTVDGDGSGLDADTLDGLESETFLKVADPATAAEVLNLLLTVDGAGSALDSDLLDGLQASKFMRSDQNTGTSGNLSVDGLFSGVNAQFTGTLTADRVEADSIHADIIRLIPADIAPNSAGEGSLYFDNPSSQIKYFSNGMWQSMDSCAGSNMGGNLVALVNTGYTLRHPNTIVEKLIDLDYYGIENFDRVPIQVFSGANEVPSKVIRWFDNNRKLLLRWKLGGSNMHSKNTAIEYTIRINSNMSNHDIPREFAIHASSDAGPASFWWAYNNYDGNFGGFAEVNTGYENSDVTVFDKDNDGDYDIVITHDNNGDHGLSIWENNGSENFSKVSTFDNDGNWAGVDSADFNEDGHIDFVASYGYSSFLNTRLYLNNGNGTFTQGGDLGQCGSCTWARRVSAGDFDGDSNMDIVSGGHGSNCPICVYWGDGNGNFSAPEAIANSNGSSDIHGITCADVDHDGDDDLFAHYNQRVPLLYLSNGNTRSFENGTASFTNDGWNPNSITSSWYDMSVWDVNKDGTLDMTGSNWDNSGKAFVAFGKNRMPGGFPDQWQTFNTEIHTAGTTCMEFTGPDPSRINVEIMHGVFYKSCLDILNNGASNGDGVYTIKPDGMSYTKVYCDMTNNEGGWTLVLSVGMGKEIIHTVLRRAEDSDRLATLGPNQPSANMLYKFSDAEINKIKTTQDAQIGYWVVTPGNGDSGEGTLGAQSFHRGDCIFQLATLENDISNECLQQVANTFTDSPNWQMGVHWWPNREGYRWAFGYQVGDHGPLGGVCYNGGEGLGAHSGGNAPFHRGWCSSQAWGQVWVR